MRMPAVALIVSIAFVTLSVTAMTALIQYKERCVTGHRSHDIVMRTVRWVR